MRRVLINALSYATRYDKLVIAACLFLTASSLLVPLLKSEGRSFRIEIDGKLHYEGELFAEKRLTFDVIYGPFVIETSKKGVRVAQSKCPNQICVKQGWRKEANDIIVCVPNKAMVAISGSIAKSSNFFDTITR